MWEGGGGGGGGGGISGGDGVSYQESGSVIDLAIRSSKAFFSFLIAFQ